jgi:hypothetical protein
MSNGRYSASVDQLSQHLLRSAARRRDQPSTRSPALRYWNLAQQRHYRRSAPCRRAMPVSGDCAACHGPHTRGKRPGFRPRQAHSRKRRTVCWREPDSNHRSRSCERLFSGRCQSETAARKAEPLTGSGPKRQCLPGVAAHSLSLRGGTTSSRPSSSSGESSKLRRRASGRRLSSNWTRHFNG